MVVDEQGFIDEEASDEKLYVTIDGRTVSMATANILKLEGVDVPQGVRAARVMEIERRYEDRYNAETMPAAAAAPATSAVPAVPAVPAVSATPAVAEDAARVLGVSAGELSSVIPTEEKGLSVAQRYEDAGDMDAASAIRGYVAERFGAAQPVVTIGGNDAASPEGVAPEAEQGAGESTQGVAPESMPQAVLSPAQQRKAKRAEIAQRIPGKGNKKLWTQAKAEDVAEYIATLTDDAALQQATADKYIAAIREKQEKMDAIEALELEDDVAFWNDVKARLAQPVAVETQTEEGATAQAPEATPTPMAMDDVAVQDVEESTPSVDSSTSNVDSSTSVPESQIENESGNENQFEDNSELGARLTNEVSNEEVVGRSLTEEEARELIEEMGAQADDMPMIEFTPEIYNEQFGENGTAGTPIGEVKMGENQIGKLFIKGRTKEYGMIYPTLTNPDIIIEEVSVANNGNTERPSSYVFVKTFNRNGEKIKFFASISVKKDGLEVVISNHFIGEKALEKKLQGSNVRYIKDSLLSNNSDGHLVEHQNDVPDLLPAQENSVSSTAESTTQSSNVQENSVKSGENAQNEGEKDVIEEIKAALGGAEQKAPTIGEQIQAAEAEVNTNPTEAQKEAGNYKKGHVQIGTFNVTIEQPKGSVRSGVDADGKKWETEMQNTYGYIRGTEGVDGDHIDVFLSDDIDGWDGHKVFVVDQRNADGSFDEHKVMLGFNDINDAEAAYMSNYEEGWQGLGAITGVSIEEFEKWIASSHRKTKAFAEYKSVKTTEGQNASTDSDQVSEQRSEQVGETDAQEDNTVLSESEYADARSAEIMADNPNLDDVEAYNMALDEYPKYIGDMINSGKLSKIYKKANIGERIALNKSIQAAGYEISDVNAQEVKEGSKKAESKFKVGDEVTATFGDGSVVSGVIEKIEDGRIKIRSNGRLYPVDESKIGKGVELQRGSLSLESEKPAFKAATEKTMQALEKTGVEVVMATEEQVQAVMEIAEMQKRTAPETASVRDEHQPTVVSSADGAKVLKDLDSAIVEYENKSSHSKTLLGDIAKVLRAKKHGSNSQYATFEAVNGKVFTIRLADHNAKTSTFDNHDENEGISIVVTAQKNNGVTNNGEAHLVEFFYDAIKLRKSDDKPLVEILKSIKQSLYSGEYTDNTGLAVREEVNVPEFLRTPGGTVYGWAVGGRIYLTPEGVNPNTPVHEYTHLWASAIEQRNPELWAEVVEAVKLSPAWAEVSTDEAYRDIWNDDSRMASEVLARLSGGENYRRTMQEAAERENDAARKFSLIAAWGRVKRALAKFWNKVREMLDLPVNGEPGNAVPAWEQFVNSAIGDFYRGVNPNVGNSPMERMFIGEQGARNLDNAQEATTRMGMNEEEQQITDRAKADGTYMKAPNGKPTKLNPKQWVQVRTKAFKKWFGDWLLAAIETPIYKSKGGFATLAEAEKWAKENLQGQSRVNKHTGEEISISRKSVNEMLAPKFTKTVNEHVHMSALQSVLDFIETGIPAEVHADTHGRDFDVMRLYNAIEIDGKVYRVKSTVRKVKEGDKYYTYEIQEMELLEDTQNVLGLLNAESGGQLNSNNSITGAKLLNGVKKTNSNEEILQYSKVVDENGEPMVVYHGTPKEKFTAFDRTKNSPVHDGFYFTDKIELSKKFAEPNGYVGAYYLDIKNPKIDGFDGSGAAMRKSEYRDGGIFTKRQSDRYAEMGTKEIIVFSPNQIKSATDNVGTFSSENDDIRYRSFGGNSGYVGYSMSKRAAEARREGRYPKTDFKKEYGVSGKSFDFLRKAGIISSSEWHHTSKFGNRTDFFSWSNDTDAEYYAANKKRIDKAINDVEKLKPEYDVMKAIDKYLSEGRSQDEISALIDEESSQVEPAEKRYKDARNALAEQLNEEFYNYYNEDFYKNYEQKSEAASPDADIRYRATEVDAEAERTDAEITAAVERLSTELNTPVEIVTNLSTSPDVRKRASKGWYEGDRVYLVLPNAESVQDAVETVLHEVVGHRGLRALFGERFDAMLDDVFTRSSKAVRSAIMERALPLIGRGRDNAIRVATEEYMAEQAERGCLRN